MASFDVPTLAVKVGSGIMPISRGDIGIVFWLNASNLGRDTQYVNAKMFRCCEFIGKLETDCNHMKLISSVKKEIKGEESVNLTLIYPTLYPHQREGTCQVDVNVVPAASLETELPADATTDVAGFELLDGGKVDHRKPRSKAAPSTSVISLNISFDTRVFLTHIPATLKDYYTLAELEWKSNEDPYFIPNPDAKICNSPDEDPLDKCSPVDCAIKYSGTRSFFDLKLRRCLKVPLCVTDSNKKEGLMVYLPAINKCVHSRTVLDKDDLKFLMHGYSEGQERGSTPTTTNNLHCHNGQENPKKGTCICDDGWTTYVAEEDWRYPPLPEVIRYNDLPHIPIHMCTIQMYEVEPMAFITIEEIEKNPHLIPVSLVKYESALDKVY